MKKTKHQKKEFPNYRYNIATGELHRYRHSHDRLIEQFDFEKELNEKPDFEYFSKEGLRDFDVYVRFSNGIVYIVTDIKRGEVKARCNELFGVQA